MTYERAVAQITLLKNLGSEILDFVKFSVDELQSHNPVGFHGYEVFNHARNELYNPSVHFSYLIGLDQQTFLRLASISEQEFNILDRSDQVFLNLHPPQPPPPRPIKTIPRPSGK